MYSIRTAGYFVLLLLIPALQATPSLTLDNYESTLNSKNALVKYHQTWCGHCKAMKPDYDELSKMFADSEQVAIVEVDCGEEVEICEAEQIEGYPTLKYFVNGVVRDYEGDRDLPSLVEFVAETLVSKCDLENSAKTCSERALKYSAKMMMKGNEELKKEVARLQGMGEGKMKLSLKSWIAERVEILKQILGEAEL